MHDVLRLLTCLLIGGAVAQPSPPQWPDCYMVQGTLRLPYAELNEPFTSYYEAKKNRSRIDYFDVMQTYQIGSSGSPNDYGYDLLVAPMTTEELINVKTCFLVNGTSDAPSRPQSIFPDISGFNFVGKATLDGKDCNVWRLITKNFTRSNTYTLWQSVSSGLPVRYEMMGYDTLIGSHYDKYYVDYASITALKFLPEEIFKAPSNITCGSFPGPGISHHRANMNPMREFIHGDDSHVENMFEHFKNTYNKEYQDKQDHEQRKHYFRNNLRYINAKNRASLSYKLAVNHFADMSDEELGMRRGRLQSTGYNGGLPFQKNDYNLDKVPEQLDWRFLGAVTQVKDQATCGSCWSFGTVGAVEGAYFLKTGQLVRFSQQELVDCSWGQGNNGCNGGEDFRAYQWIMKHGLATEEAYGSYMGVDGYCKMKTVPATVNITGYVNVTTNDVDALKTAMAFNGPISIGIDASHRSLSFYSHGVYYEPQCSSTDLDHAVLAVGYGVLNGEPYWLVKNSWSTYWGNDGYVLMSQKENNCGVLTSPTYVLV